MEPMVIWHAMVVTKTRKDSDGKSKIVAISFVIYPLNSVWSTKIYAVDLPIKQIKRNKYVGI